MNLTLTLEDEIILLDKYRLTSDELLFTRVLLILQEDNNEELFAHYIKVLKENGVSLKNLISSLQAKEIILSKYKIKQEGQQFNPFEIPLNKNFIKNIYKASFELGKELFETYPQFGIINNCQVPLRSVAKHFDSLEDCYFRYGKCIKWNAEKHKQIIELVKWAKENNILCMSLSSFIINNSWLDLEAMKESNTGNINPIRLL